MMKVYFFLAVLCISSANKTLAQAVWPSLADSSQVQQLQEIEVRAMYSSISTRRFPATVYSLNPNLDNTILPVNINEGLNRIPAIYAHTGTFNTSRITMRGIGTRSLYGTRKINALLNDIPLTSGEGDTFIDDIDLRFIDRIETVAGPTAGIYGPALGGSLLLYELPSQENSLSFQTGFGSYGTFTNSVLADIVKGSSQFSLKYKNVNSHGYRQNNAYNRHSALLGFNRQGQKSEWNILALFTDVKAEIPSSIDSAAFALTPEAAASTWAKTNGRENTQRLLGGISHQYKFTPLFTFNTTIYGLYKKTIEVRPFNYLNEEDISGGLKLYIRKMLRSEVLAVTSGFSVFGERYNPSLYENVGGEGVKGNKVADNVENIFQVNAFAIVDYIPNPKNYVTISFNLNKFGFNDKNVFINAPLQRYNHKVNFSPRLSVSRQLARNHYAFGSISHGLSYPSMQEIIYPDGTINNQVKPESAWSFEAGFKGIKLFNELKYAFSTYYMPVKDLIVPERIAEDTYVGQNVGKSEHSGIEASIEKSVPIHAGQEWLYFGDYKVAFTWQRNKFGYFMQDGVNYEGNNLPGVPQNRLFALVNLRVKSMFFVEPEVYLNGKTPMNDSNTRYYNAYSILNLRFGWTHQLPKLKLNLSAAINNMANEKYASMILINAPSPGNRPPRYYYPGLPRNYMIVFAIDL